MGARLDSTFGPASSHTRSRGRSIARRPCWLPGLFLLMFCCCPYRPLATCPSVRPRQQRHRSRRLVGVLSLESRRRRELATGSWAEGPGEWSATDVRPLDGTCHTSRRPDRAAASVDSHTSNSLAPIPSTPFPIERALWPPQSLARISTGQWPLRSTDTCTSTTDVHVVRCGDATLSSPPTRTH